MTATRLPSRMDEVDVGDDPELLQPAASSVAATRAVAARETRRRGVLIDTPYVDNGFDGRCLVN